MEPRTQGPSVILLGSGSWATALVKIMQDSLHTSRIHWYVRKPDTAEHIRQKGRNRDYGKGFHVPLDMVDLYDVTSVLPTVDLIIHAIPSAYSSVWYREKTLHGLSAPIVISASKGIVPEAGVTTLQWLREKIHARHYLFLGGPCHSEEVMQESRSYLTLGSTDEGVGKSCLPLFSTEYLSATLTPYAEALEFFGIMKNIMAIAVGMATGLGYGDNFMAILVSAAFREIRNMAMDRGLLPEPDLSLQGGFIGDLLVTCYSPHSRNRRFGFLMARGYSADEALTDLHMVPEGYFVLKAWKDWLHQERYPIARTLCHICLEGYLASKAFKKLENFLGT
ncbi:MAG: hypothetical protein N2110_03530 [Flavobacteriales bacterium]|nr:hypothetical protein [Flavobacteriales bacterium]MCX7768080.1 hypothetical protein [Flavobacteriales bacterium]MDW8410354.1 hypothetical protein [Flavobacteriales bacterium]